MIQLDSNLHTVLEESRNESEEIAQNDEAPLKNVQLDINPEVNALGSKQSASAITKIIAQTSSNLINPNDTKETNDSTKIQEKLTFEGNQNISKNKTCDQVSVYVIIIKTISNMTKVVSLV